MREADVGIGALTLDGGESLPAVVQRVTMYGHRNRRTVFVPHALTGSSRVAEWWPGIVGDGAPFDPSEWCVIGINALGSCYGSTGPTSVRAFPRVTVRDIVRAQRRALDELGVDKIDVVIGGSLGGMQALQWAIDAPDRVGRAIVVGAHDHHSAMGIALNTVQRDALALDPVRGLRLARKIAMLTYKSAALLDARHGRNADRRGARRFDVEGYLEHQADLFERRMDAATYETLTLAMDSFDVRCHPEPGERSGRTRLTFAGISTDWLFRPSEVRAAVQRFAASGWNARYVELKSDHGHDAFLAESHRLAALIAPPASERSLQQRNVSGVA
jgi:homoserine O-acetyltransferase